ncbi:MAG: YceH family protein [Trueperaceae bacterium]
MPLSDVELRVLGVLVEKERTTPETYPLSTGSLHTGCNQRTNRDPVIDLHLREVTEALQRLRDRGLATTVQEVSDRVPKHRHLLARALDVDDRELALVAVLMLRGAQTPGELRTRTERYVSFADVPSVTAVLERLAARSTALVRCLGRAPGQSQDRWVHTLGVDEERQRPRVRPVASEPEAEGAAPSDAAAEGPAGDGAATGPDVAALLGRLEALEGRVAALERRWAASGLDVERD